MLQFDWLSRKADAKNDVDRVQSMFVDGSGNGRLGQQDPIGECQKDGGRVDDVEYQPVQLLIPRHQLCCFARLGEVDVTGDDEVEE